MLAIFDTEGVLVDGEFMPEVAKLIGKEDEIDLLTQKGLRGEIKWEEGLKKRVETLRGISYDVYVQTVQKMRLMPGAVEAIQNLKAMGFKTITISGGPTLLVERLKVELGLDYTFANDLLFTNHKISGVNMRVNSDKASVLHSVLAQLGEDRKSIVSIVDGANDLTLFDIAGLSIAFNAQEIVEERADIIIRKKDMMEIIPVVRDHFFPKNGQSKRT